MKPLLDGASHAERLVYGIITDKSCKNGYKLNWPHHGFGPDEKHIMEQPSFKYGELYHDSKTSDFNLGMRRLCR